MAAELSHRMGWIDQQLLGRVESLLVRAQLPVAFSQGMQHVPHMLYNTHCCLSYSYAGTLCVVYALIVNGSTKTPTYYKVDCILLCVFCMYILI